MKRCCVVLFVFISGIPVLARGSEVSNTITHESGPPSLEVRLSGADLYNTLTNDVMQKVNSQTTSAMYEQLKLMYTILAGVFLLAGFLGVRSLSDLRKKVAIDVAEELSRHDTLERLLDACVREHLKTDIESKMNKVSKELSFYRLSNLAAQIESGSGFKPAQRDAAVEALKELENECDLISRKDFAEVLEKIVDSFTAADLDYELGRIAEGYESICCGTKGIATTLMTHYGMKVLGDVEVEPTTILQFRKYCSACRRHDLYELALPYLLVFEYQENKDGWKDRVQSLLLDATCLDKSEKETMFKVLRRNADPKQVAKVPTGQVIRFSHKFDAFINEYKEQLQDVLSDTLSSDDKH